MRNRLVIVLILLVFVVIRIRFLAVGGVAIDADEAIVGLMGRHILEGRHSTYYYGQNYMGSLEGYLAAAVFYLFGSSPLALKAVPLLVSIAFLLASGYLATLLFDRKTGVITGLLLASPPLFFVHWGLKARGGYIETLLLGTLLLILTFRLIDYPDKPTAPAVTLGARRKRIVTVLNALLAILLALALLIALSGGTVIRWPVRVSLTSWQNPARFAILLLILKWLLVVSVSQLKALWDRRYAGLVALSAFVAGLAWWTNQLVVFYLLPIGLVVVLRERKRVFSSSYQCGYGGLALLAFGIGYLPALLFHLTAQGGLSTFAEPVSVTVWLARVRHYFTIGMPVILGCRGPWSWTSLDSWFSGALILLHAASMATLLVVILRKHRRASAAGQGWLWLDRLGVEEILLLSVCLYPAVFAASSVGWFISEPRYLLPLYSVLPVATAALLAALWRRSRLLCLVVAGVRLAFPLYDQARTDMVTLQPWVAHRRLPIAFDPLIAFMHTRNLTRAYADYWIAYRLTFESDESIITTVYPPGQDRYPAYTALVDAHPSPAYIKMNSQRGFPALLQALGIERYAVEAIGNMVVYYDVELPRPAAAPVTLARDGWTVSASHGSAAAGYAIDGDKGTRWTSGSLQVPGIAVALDFGREEWISGVVLSTGTALQDYPRGLAVHLSDADGNWETVARSDDLTRDMPRYMRVRHPISMPGSELVFSFPPRRARAIRLETLRDSDTAWWSIATLEVIAAPGAEGGLRPQAE